MLPTYLIVILVILLAFLIFMCVVCLYALMHYEDIDPDSVYFDNDREEE